MRERWAAATGKRDLLARARQFKLSAKNILPVVRYERRNRAFNLPARLPEHVPLEVEKISDTQIGRIHGAKDNDYTSGAVCAKVARYAERIHHPDRLMKPLRRVGEKGVGIEAFEEITWDEALDDIAKFEAIKANSVVKPFGPITSRGRWVGSAADGLDRFRHARDVTPTLDDLHDLAGSRLERRAWRSTATIHADR